jgi:hypothetical protein
MIHCSGGCLQYKTAPDEHMAFFIERKGGYYHRSLDDAALKGKIKVLRNGVLPGYLPEAIDRVGI